MTQPIPPHLEGQFEAPNPIELFWEKHKRVIIAGAIAAILAIAVNYVMAYSKRQETNALWGGLATSIGFDKGYAEDGQFARFARQGGQMMPIYYSATSGELLTTLDDDLREVDEAALRAEVERVRGTPAEPLARWALAQRLVLDESWDEAVRALEELRASFPDHFLTVESSYPFQLRPEVAGQDESGETAEKADPKKPPELEPAVAGSAVSRLLAAIEAERAFRAANPQFFEAKQPDSSETAVLELERDGDSLGVIKVKFFEKAAPKHVARVLELLGEGFWDGLSVHEIRRQGDDLFGPSGPSELLFGWRSTKDPDVSKWEAGEVAEEDVLDWEGADAGLSHFPGTVAVEPSTDGKSQVERIVINGADVADQRDGSRVIIGRVVEGLEIVQDIIDNTGFQTEDEDRRGSGRPADRIEIKSFRVE